MVSMNLVQLQGWEPYQQFANNQGMRLGTIGVTPDGRWFKWTKNGASALAAGKLVQAEVPGANFDELAIASAYSIGDKVITVTNGATAITANMFAGGYMNIEDDTGEGVVYAIASHPAADTSATCAITLANGISVALGSAATVSLTKHKCDSVIIHPSPPTAGLVGVPLLAVTASYYFWAQFRGTASLLTDGTLVIGKLCMASDGTDGAVEDYVLAEGTPNTLANSQVVGTVLEVAVTTEYSLIDMNLA